MSRAPAIMPLGCSSLGFAQAMSWNLQHNQRKSMILHMRSAYLESVTMLAVGCSSTPCSELSRLRSHKSSFVSSEKSASTAPALVPVTRRGCPEPGDHANAAVRGISRSLTMATFAPVLPRSLWCSCTAMRGYRSERSDSGARWRTVEVWRSKSAIKCYIQALIYGPVR